jgi:hypothetical protein
LQRAGDTGGTSAGVADLMETTLDTRAAATGSGSQHEVIVGAQTAVRIDAVARAGLTLQGNGLAVRVVSYCTGSTPAQYCTAVILQ